MKILPLLFVLGSSVTVGVAQAQTAPAAETATVKTDTLLLEAGCGQCRLGLPGKGCDLAVRFECKAYFVAGTSIDAHGDAHARDGFCNAVRQARVQGAVVDNRFKVSYFKLVPEARVVPMPKP